MFCVLLLIVIDWLWRLRTWQRLWSTCFYWRGLLLSNCKYRDCARRPILSKRPTAFSICRNYSENNFVLRAPTDCEWLYCDRDCDCHRRASTAAFYWLWVTATVIDGLKNQRDQLLSLFVAITPPIFRRAYIIRFSYSLLLSFACCLSFCASSWLHWRDMPKFCCVITKLLLHIIARCKLSHVL